MVVLLIILIFVLVLVLTAVVIFVFAVVVVTGVVLVAAAVFVFVPVRIVDVVAFVLVVPTRIACFANKYTITLTTPKHRCVTRNRLTCRAGARSATHDEH